MKKIINATDLDVSLAIKGVRYNIGAHGEINNVPDDAAYIIKKTYGFLQISEIPTPDIEAIIAPVVEEVEETKVKVKKVKVVKVKVVKEVVKKPPKVKVEVKKIKKLLKVISKKRGRSKKMK